MNRIRRLLYAYKYDYGLALISHVEWVSRVNQLVAELCSASEEMEEEEEEEEEEEGPPPPPALLHYQLNLPSSQRFHVEAASSSGSVPRGTTEQRAAAAATFPL